MLVRLVFKRRAGRPGDGGGGELIYYVEMEINEV